MNVAMNDAEQFDRLAKLGAGETGHALGLLAEQFKGEGRFHELFDIRLLEARHRLGLPAVVTFSLDELPEPLRMEVENAYLAACREVGHALLDAGKIGEAWRYLRPVGDNIAVAGKIEAIAP